MATDRRAATPLRWASTPARQALFAIGSAAVLLLAFLGAREVCNPDEPRDAETAREALAGDWSIAPEINGKPFEERPPLFYWMTAGAYAALGGPGDATARVVPVLLGILTIASTWLLGETLLGRGRGWLPALLLLGTPYLFWKFRTCVTDTGLVGFTALSLALFFRAWKTDSWAWAAAAGAAAGLAFLCKGLLGLGIPAVAAGAFLAMKRDLAAILRLRLWLAVLCGLALVLPWVWALQRVRGTGGLHAFFVVQHLGRLGEDADHAKPFWYYVVLLWVGLPLTPLAIAGFHPRNRMDPPVREAFVAGACWVVPMLVILSAIGGKRPIYLAPLLPGLALAAAAVVEAAAAGGLVSWAKGVVEVGLRTAEAVTHQFPWAEGRTLPVRFAWTAIVLAGLALGWDAGWEASRNAESSGYAMASLAAEAAGPDRLVGWRVGEGAVGQFAFALRRKFPVSWTEADLRRRLGDRRAVLLAEGGAWDRALADGSISTDLALRLRPLGEGVAGDHPYVLYEWNGGGRPAPAPPK